MFKYCLMLVVTLALISSAARSEEGRANGLSEKQKGALMEKLKSADPVVRNNALWEISGLDSKLGCQVALEMLNDPSERMRLAALKVIRNHNYQTVAAPKVMGLLHDPSFRIRANALDVVGNAKYMPASAEVLKALNDGNSDVRGAAAYAAGSMKLHEAQAQLQNLTHDPDEDVRDCATAALSMLDEN